MLNTKEDVDNNVEKIMIERLDVDEIKEKLKELQQIKALWITHIGAYESLNVAYKAIFDYAQEHNIKCAIPTREIYVKGPGMIFKGNPNKYVTEIIIPIE